MPAKAGIQKYLKTLASAMLHYVPRLRGNDAKGRIKTFYETITLRSHKLFLNFIQSV